MQLNEWAERWNVPPEALADLREAMTVTPSPPNVGGESAVQAAIRLEAPSKGCILWRNNVGACYDDRGRFIRYGLANDSKALNSKVKSADLVGIRPVTVTPEMVGKVIGQFISREVKAGGWKYSGSDRERAQLKWAEIVAAYGGDACFATGAGTL
ncbi:hypothetical protein [Marinobacter sp.]|uniref:hypothetical protein n=1 Tax=Marinobacter sp. TaxID=50741 RepID=UPI000C8BFCAC|nr:hypothetical protein [Marinobacter sp.]MAB53449.1 hypothetical protein [Marinobacter sp.]|tara:strand:- start:1434 stop:1898 length:465 start_codon:yes stop_codon:yes gene_type:complete